MEHIIEKYKNKIFDDKIYFHPNIPSKKLKNAIKSYANIGNETPLALIDDTIFGSAKAGLLLTNNAIYIKDSNSKNSFSCLLNKIEKVSFKNYILMQNLTINETLKIDFTQPNKKSLSLFSDMLLELNEIQLQEESSSWSNIGIGVGIGALFGGPIGAAIGGAIGASLENKNSKKNTSSYEEDTELVFVVTLASMMAKMAKADGSISQSEANQISELFDELDFTNEKRAIAIKAFKNAKDDEFSIYDYARQYKKISDYDLQEFLYSVLWLIALADGEIHENEKYILKKIPPILGLPQSKFDEFWNDIHNKKENNNKYQESNTTTLEECYTILGCNQQDSMQIIKKKYRILISEYHPDKIQSKGLPESFMKFATEQMQKINFAYDTIKNSRT
jgi:DnaJ like chaperone protein